ncbi:MAG: hypothetical protein ABIR68_04425 [Ilumatobacteraceae bacterium]
MAATKKAPAKNIPTTKSPSAKTSAATKQATKQATTTSSAKTSARVKKAPATSRPTAAANTLADQVTAAAEQVQTAAGSIADTAAARATAALKSFPSIDFSNFDVETLKQLDPRKIDWSKIEVPELDGQKLLGAVRDAAYITVGFGVLAVQKAQVRRRELADTISDRFGANKQQVEDLIAAFEARITKLDDTVEARVDHAVSMLGDRLPDQAEMLLNQVHSVAKSARKQVRGLITSAA